MSISRALWYIVIAIVAICVVDAIVWHGGEIIDVLLVIAVILVIYNLVTGRRRV
ncbi:MAG TPA: hypothetical protein VMD91_15605 [Candidatus Sulfotelmatobacter sp.]|nr:hypothetical protein [Candidatus Sulfotelmatobacter sp.]